MQYVARMPVAMMAMMMSFGGGAFRIA